MRLFCFVKNKRLKKKKKKKKQKKKKTGLSPHRDISVFLEGICLEKDEMAYIQNHSIMTYMP